MDIYIKASDEKHGTRVTYSVFPQNKRKPLKNRILKTVSSRVGKVHSMHCKILLKYHRKYRNHRNLGAAALA